MSTNCLSPFPAAGCVPFSGRRAYPLLVAWCCEIPHKIAATRLPARNDEASCPKSACRRFGRPSAYTLSHT